MIHCPMSPASCNDTKENLPVEWICCVRSLPLWALWQSPPCEEDYMKRSGGPSASTTVDATHACQKAAWAVKQFMYCHGINNAFCCLHCSWNELSLMRHLCWHRVSQMMYKYPSNEGTHSVVRQKWIQAHFDCSDGYTRDFLHFMITQIWCLLVTKSLISWMQYKPLF